MTRTFRDVTRPAGFGSVFVSLVAPAAGGCTASGSSPTGGTVTGGGVDATNPDDPKATTATIGVGEREPWEDVARLVFEEAVQHVV